MEPDPLPPQDGIQIPIKTQANGKPQFAYRNNNPGNLEFAGQAGATMGEGGFAKFATPEEGIAALHRQILLDQRRGVTIQQFVTKYAPPFDKNDTASYIKELQQKLGMPASAPLSAASRYAISQFVTNRESGTDSSGYDPDAKPLPAAPLARPDMTRQAPVGWQPNGRGM